ncbi:MAG: COG3014 family protein [bacterium]
MDTRIVSQPSCRGEERTPSMHSVLLIAAVCGLFAGCSHQDRMKDVIAPFEKGDYGRAAEAMRPLLKDRRDSEKDRTIYELEAGAVFAASGDLTSAMKSLGIADERMWEYLDDAPEVRISEQAAAILTNQTIIAYVGRPHDRIMCTTYQGLNHLALGDLEAAGVSFRRALEWQRDAVDKNQKEIDALEEKATEASKEKSYDAKAALEDAKVKDGLESAYGPLRELRGYADFEIPYATYLRSLQQTLTGRNDDLAQATVGFRRVAGMLPENERAYVADAALAAERATQGSALPATVHVFVESGMAPWLREFRLDIPLFIREVPYVGVAFPVLELKGGAIAEFTAVAGGETRRSLLLTDMDRVVGDDFNRRLPAIITMTIVSSATKAIATYFAQQAVYRDNPNAAIFVALAGAIYQIATNSADLRTWLTLPKFVLYAPVSAPADGRISIQLGDGRTIGPLEVESSGTSIVHLRIPAAGSEPALRIMRFPGVGQPVAPKAEKSEAGSGVSTGAAPEAAAETTTEAAAETTTEAAAETTTEATTETRTETRTFDTNETSHTTSG